MEGELKPGMAYRSAIEPFCDEISIYDGPKTFLKQFAAAPVEVGHLLAAHWCQSEVANGGLHQFFSNPTGVLAPEARAGFSSIGIEEWASIVGEAMRFFGEPYPREQAKRLRKLPKAKGAPATWNVFQALDDRFYAWLRPDRDRWARAADAYASRYVRE
ncbi:DMP19 family protein [Bradyrhizobium sp.]|uniref:DMP19 family protein n=1 Tax=Bradyrhizobium sp. TaxID=376 RepID=UPI0025C72BB0|nr:DUF4375 domain-containing protein [Bradyrhizobium sp.]MBV8917707.1 DUF4375 domain-containing protein [Bradyrhizobium sp.]